MKKNLIIFILIFFCFAIGGPIACNEKIGDGVYSPLEKAIVRASTLAVFKSLPSAIGPVNKVSKAILDNIPSGDMVTADIVDKILKEKTEELGFSEQEVEAMDIFVDLFKETLVAKYAELGTDVPLENRLIVVRELIVTVHEVSSTVMR